MRITFLILSIILSGNLLAKDTSSGCGLGWAITDKKSLSASSTRTTTNGIVPNTFGMTSGTLGCEEHSLVKTDMAPLYFTEVNYEILLTEMAEGKGEILEAFAHLLGCEQNRFSQSVQNAYGRIVTFDNSPSNLLKKVKSEADCQKL